MQSKPSNDPVEEVTIRLANLELTIRVREIGATSAGQTGVTASGYELVSSVQTPEPPLESEGPSLPVAVEQSLLEATSARTLTGFHLDFLTRLANKLRGTDREWTPRARVARAYRAGLIARRRLEGEVLEHSSPGTPYRVSYYLVLRSPRHPLGCWTTDYNRYLTAVGPSTAHQTFADTSVSHGFASHAECEAYLVGASRPWPRHLD